jgi:transposase
MKYYRGSGQPDLFPDLFEDKYYRGIAKPDLFEDDSDIEYQEFCKNLMSLAEDLQIIKNKLDIAISTCPEGRLRKKKRARLQYLIRDLSALLQEIDPDRIGITYNEYTQEVTGPLFDLIQISAQHLDINVPDNSRSLGKAIQRAIKADSWTTAIKPSGFLKTPQEEKNEQFTELLNDGWDIRTIADILEESRSTIQRKTDREKNKLLRLFDAGWKISEIAQKRGLNESVVQNWIDYEKSRVLKMQKDGRDISDICQKLGHKESLVKKLITH